MHNLALALAREGHSVSGSDDEIYNPARDRLAAYGLLPTPFGWDPERISADLDLVILGMHAHRDNPELQRAMELEVPIFSYPEFLYRHARSQRRVVIAGSHGKTTTTSLIMHLLQKSNSDFDYLVGAQIEGFELMVRLSDAPAIVIEGDEYLSSALDPRPKFLHYRPHLVVITGIAWDHMNVFPTFEEYRAQFARLLEVVEPGGKVFYFEGDPHLQELCAAGPAHLEYVPYRAFPAVREGEVSYLELNGERLPLQLFGQHNLENVRAAYLVARELGLSDGEFAAALPSFRGAAKRLQLLAANGSRRVYLDFAHAPSKVRATVHAVREQFPDARLLACFELHTYSSLNQAFLPQYGGAMDEADEAIVFFTPHTLEMKRLPPLDPEQLRGYFRRSDLLVFTDSADLQRHLQEAHPSGPTVWLLMTSGNLGGLNLPELAGLLLKAPKDPGIQGS